MANNDLTKALMKRYDVQEFQDGGAPMETGAVQMGMLGPYRDTSSEVEAMRNLAEGALVGGGAGAAMKAAQEFMSMAETQPSLKNTPEYQAAQQMLMGAAGSGLVGAAGSAISKGLKGIGAETGAVISDAETVDPAQALGQAIQELQIQKSQTEDPGEIKLLEKMIENAAIAANAPYASLMEEVAATGGEDDLIAHVRSGDINVSRELVNKNPKIEKEIEKTAIEMGLDPEEMVHGTGLASLNVYTGVEQHGFLKKLAKGIKKIAKKVAPIAGPLANFIPGVGPVLAGVIGAGTNLAAGKGLKGAITS